MPRFNDRAEARNHVALDGTLEFQQGLLAGKLFDISRNGAFFCPEAGLVDGRYCGPKEAVRVIESGAQGVVRVAGDHEMVRNIEVRWSGASKDHWCWGMGIRFDEQLWDPPPHID